MDPYLILAVAMLCLSWWLLKPRRATATPLGPTESGLTSEQTRAATDAITSMQVRLVEQNRELEAALQTRAALLDALIADADERIADLRQQVEFQDVPGGRNRAA